MPSTDPQPPAAALGVDGITVTAAIAPNPGRGAGMVGYVNLGVKVSNGTQGGTIPGHISADEAVTLALSLYRAAVEADTDALIHTLVTELGDKTLADALTAAVYQARVAAAIPDYAPPA